MGRDKALLSLPARDGKISLWAKQYTLLQSLGPVALLISGPRKPFYPPEVRSVPDKWEGTGPLGGIATCLEALSSPLVLVLALDLPRMNAPFLVHLLSQCTANTGIVPRRDGRFEPLAAIYPIAASRLAIQAIKAGAYRLQDFVLALVQNRLLSIYDVSPQEQYLLLNWNMPDDVNSGLDAEDWQ
jgi:molybdopterin-guanine dinucleotide biosynthesis protein A